MGAVEFYFQVAKAESEQVEEACRFLSSASIPSLQKLAEKVHSSEDLVRRWVKALPPGGRHGPSGPRPDGAHPPDPGRAPSGNCSPGCRPHRFRPSILDQDAPAPVRRWPDLLGAERAWANRRNSTAWSLRPPQGDNFTK